MEQDAQTAQDEKTLWNRKYTAGSHVSVDPDPFLVSAYSEFLAGTTPGRALDVAGGVGRHALWLAQRGWNVRLVDVSEVGINLAWASYERNRGVQPPEIPSRTAVVRAGVEELPQAVPAGRLETEILDLAQTHDLGQGQYDLIVVFFYLQRPLFPALVSALRPGGFLIYKTYTTESKRLGRGPSHPMYLLGPNELLRSFQELRVLHYHETLKERGIAELVLQKS